MPGTEITPAEFLERLRAERAVAVLRAVPEVERLVPELVAGGLVIAEITLDSPGALDSIGRLAADEELRAAGLLVGAGTVRSAAQVDAAVDAGARFCVAPGTVEEALARARDRGVPFVPGALTPTEVERAHALGATAVKLFPASLGGPRYVRELLAPLADVPLMATGGIDADNAGEFIEAGAIAVGAGTSLTRAAEPRVAARALMDAVR